MIEMRKCLESDIVQTGQFYDDVIAWLNDHINYPRWILHVYPCEQSVRTMTWEGSQYICVDGETIIGAFAINTKPQGKYYKGKWSRDLADGSYMVIHSLAVDPKMRRQGIGSDIIRFCIDKAKSDQYQAIRVDIVPANNPARKLFENNGFMYVGDTDLELGIADIPAFSLYELNL